MSSCCARRPRPYKWDVCLCYNSGIEEHVTRKFMPILERVGLMVNFYERDSTPGGVEAEERIEAITKSEHIILLAEEKTEGWTLYQIYSALSLSPTDPRIITIVVGSGCKDDLRVLKPFVSINLLNRLNRKYFWERLFKSLKIENWNYEVKNDKNFQEKLQKALMFPTLPGSIPRFVNKDEHCDDKELEKHDNTHRDIDANRHGYDLQSENFGKLLLGLYIIVILTVVILAIFWS